MKGLWGEGGTNMREGGTNEHEVSAPGGYEHSRDSSGGYMPLVPCPPPPPTNFF
jgi:hypothetical protein